MKNRSLYTVRSKKRERHPNIIVDANKTKFKSVNLTHSKGKKGHWNIPLKNNPNKSDSKKSYVKKDIKSDYKFNYSKAFKNYELSEEDIKLLKNFLNKKRK